MTKSHKNKEIFPYNEDHAAIYMLDYVDEQLKDDGDDSNAGLTDTDYEGDDQDLLIENEIP